MVSAQRHLPGALPSPPALYPRPRRLSPPSLGRFGDRSPARSLLCWMLLGVDDVVVRWWRDELVMDYGYCHTCVRGESRGRAPCLACCGRRPHLRRYLPADAIGHVRAGPASWACTFRSLFLKAFDLQLPFLGLIHQADQGLHIDGQLDPGLGQLREAFTLFGRLCILGELGAEVCVIATLFGIWHGLTPPKEVTRFMPKEPT